MKTANYTCGLCKRPGSVEYQDDTPPEYVRILLPLVACNRCADYRVQTDRIRDRISAACWLLMNLKYEKPDKAAQVRTKVGEKLEVLTKDYARIVCRYHRHGYVWDEEFVTQIIEKPENSLRIMGLYERNIKSRKFV